MILYKNLSADDENIDPVTGYVILHFIIIDIGEITECQLSTPLFTIEFSLMKVTARKRSRDRALARCSFPDD